MADDAFPLPGVTAIQTVADWENFFHPAFGSGVVPDVGSALVPSLDTSGRNIVIQPGAAIVRAFYKPVSAVTYVPIPAAASQNRIDRLVLRLNRSAAAGDAFVQPVVITGTASSSPQAPAVTQTSDGLWDLPVARWTSASNGSLTGLVDERAMISSPMVVMPSTAGEPSLDRASLLIQPDTGMLLLSPSAGAAWETVFKKDDWHNAGGADNGWASNLHPSTYFYYKFISPGIVMVTFSMVVPAKTPGGVQILQDALPPAYRPPQTKDIVCYTDQQQVVTSGGNDVQSIISVHPDGTVTARGFAERATTASGNGVYPVDSPY